MSHSLSCCSRAGTSLRPAAGPPSDRRTESAQAEVLAAVAGAVIASDAGAQACEWFGLRDGLTTAAWSARFGILRDDYTPKPAFTTLQHLIATASMR